MYNAEYIEEKVEMVRMGVKSMDIGLETDNISLVINGILTIEDALGSLHVGAGRAMKNAGQVEYDYGLRTMGTIRKGD